MHGVKRASFRLAACIFFATLVAQRVAVQIAGSHSRGGEVLVRTLLWLYGPFVDMVMACLESSQFMTASIVGICIGTLFVSTVITTMVMYVVSLVHRGKEGRG